MSWTALGTFLYGAFVVLLDPLRRVFHEIWLHVEILLVVNVIGT
jgi:hypothetical protein